MTEVVRSAPTRDNPYIADIRAQPMALDRLIDSGLTAAVLEALRRAARAPRIVLTGMGSSLFGMYPAYLRLAAAGLPVWLVDTAELLDVNQGPIGESAFLWITSQSGEAAEVVELLDRLRGRRDVVILGVTNEESSPLGASAHATLSLHSGSEHTVATRSYLNTIVASTLAADALLGTEIDADLPHAPGRIAEYLEDWDTHLAHISEALPRAPTFFIGRGVAAATARMAGLTVKEAARHASEGMSVAQFRHGPLEMAGPDVAVVLVAGTEVAARQRDERMRLDLIAAGARCVWLDAQPLAAPSIRAPRMTSAVTRALGDIVPIQMLTVVLAARAGAQPGQFNQIDKVTRVL